MSGSNEKLELPPSSIWPHIAKISINEDKPIIFDYWLDSIDKKVMIGVKENKEKLACASLTGCLNFHFTFRKAVRNLNVT